MGEAKRKREATEREKRDKQDRRKKIQQAVGVATYLFVLLVLPAIIGVWISHREVTKKMELPKSSPPQKASPSPKQVVKRTVINTPEGFMRLAQEAERANQWGDATTYWKTVIEMSGGGKDAWRGYARAAVQVALIRHKTQPALAISHRMLSEAHQASQGFLQVSPENPLAHELCAYALALQGQQTDALMHAGNAEACAMRSGVKARNHNLMGEVITIASQRRRRTGMDLPPQVPGVPIRPR